jgi:hypothetical protein
MHLGGILRKELNIVQTTSVLNILNRHFCKPQLSTRDFNDIVKSLDKYISLEGEEIASTILRYLRIVEEATARDVKEALGFKKEQIDSSLSWLVKEGYAYKKSRIFHVTKRADWKDTFLDEGKVIDYQMPYFQDTAIFRDGDMTVIGAKTKVGKSHIALNIIKQLVSQGKKPYYISLESGNRFVSIAMALGMKEGDFYWCVHFRPENIELEKGAITIIDWLLPSDYAETDKLYKYFAEQLVKNKGTLIIFVQLKDNGDFFAKNMIAMFPALVTRYFYDDDEKGDTGYFIVDYMREPRVHKKRHKIPCKYDWDTKELTIVGNAIEEEDNGSFMESN